MTKAGGQESKGHYLLLSHEEKLRQRLLGNGIVDLLDGLLYKAIDLNSSDIHFQPEAACLRVRYRVDGVLHDQETINADQMYQILSRIKVLSGLDIAERRVPQDGTITVVVASDFSSSKPVPIDLRVSTFPSTYGEKVVIRILDRSKNMLEITSLGIPDDLLQAIELFIAMPNGLFLVTGPTGSGKTTSLYAMLGQMNHREKNIVTMEDPVEYDLPGITQTQINNKLGFTFENGLRSMLRQDPDIIMVGEIRDLLTVRMAIESALTGHLVLSTLHTNNAAGAITRLLDMEVEPFLINAALIGVLAQRLLRKLCDHCKREHPLKSHEKKYFVSSHIFLTSIWRAKGCKTCSFLGYQGRIGIFELLVINDGIRRLILEKASTQAIQDQAKLVGFKTLFDQGLSLVAQGVVSLEELLVTIGDF